MEFKKFIVQACCGKKTIIYKIGKPLTKDILDDFKKESFKELEHFTKSGILYLESENFIITGPIGSDRLTVKVKKDMSLLQNFEDLLSKL